jgi:hypothetical protein
MSDYELRVYERPIPPYSYAIGGDPAEGLPHGDDSVLEVMCLDTGFQCAELQGKIDPFTFAELAFMLGNYYNEALIGIENNKDGGANRVLHELGYPNIYYEQKDTGEPYDKATIKMGLNMNVKNRHKLVAQARHFWSDGSCFVASRYLAAQMEIFVLRNTKFEAIPGGHDDLVMAFVIACEMMRIGWLFQEAKTRSLNPIWEGKELQDAFFSDIDVHDSASLIDRHVDQSRTKAQQEDPDYAATIEALV